MISPVRIGIVGYGYWGPNLARNFHTLPSSRLEAVCDVSPDRLEHFQKYHPGIATYANFEDMLRYAQLDAVAIAVPLVNHYKLARAALLAGKHVLIEKPMASSSAECLDLMDIAKQKGLILMVDHTFLHAEPIRRIQSIIESGDIGEIRYINCQRLNLGIFQKDVNVAWDLAPHDLSIILLAMGDMPLTVNCQGNAHVNPEVEDVTNISLTFSDNRFATIQSSWLEPRKVRQITFVGTQKMIVYDDLEPHGKIRIYDVRVDCPPHCDTFAEFQYSYHYGECRIPHIDQKEPLNRICSYFIDCIKNSPQKPCSPLGLKVVQILEACSKSLETRGSPVDMFAQKSRAQMVNF